MSGFSSNANAQRPDTAGRPPLVSVVVPAYNSVATLDATLESIRRQTLKEIEVIVVDDGSTDATAEMARGWTDRLPLTVITKRNGGVSSARNSGIAVARGTYVAPLDSDDIWHPTYLEKLSAALEAGGKDFSFAYAWFRKINADNAVTLTRRPLVLSGWIQHQMLYHNVVGNGSGLVFRRAIGIACGGYPVGLDGNEDIYFQLRLAGAGRVICVPEWLVGYRDVAGSMSKAKEKNIMMCFRSLYRIPLEFPHLAKAPVTWGHSRQHARLGSVRARQMRLADSFAHFTQAIIEDPAGTLARVWINISTRLQTRRAKAQPRRNFYDLDSTVGVATRGGPLFRARMRQCAEWDAKMEQARERPRAAP